SVSEPWWIGLIKAAIIVNVLLLTFAYLTWAERKLLGRMQRRLGPNRAGPYGLLQPIADLVKLIRKESFFPANAVDVLYIAAPALGARRRHDGALALARRHRPPARRHDPVRRTAGRRPPRLLRRRCRRDEPGAVRPAGGRHRARRRVPHRVQRHALGPLPDGRV